MKKIIYVLGNPIDKTDNIAVKLIPGLIKLYPQFDFVHFDPTEEFLPQIDKELIMIDTVVGINKVTVFHDLKHFSNPPGISVHDYDLLLHLKLMQKLGKVRKIILIGVPSGYKLETVLEELKPLLLNSI